MTAVVNVEVFAHIAPGMRFDGRTLTLVAISPSTIWMSRPLHSPGDAPELSYLPTGAFLDRWTDQAREVGPTGCLMRGTLSLLDPDAQIAGRTDLEVRAPRVTADGLAYDIKILAGIVPGSSGPACCSSNGPTRGSPRIHINRHHRGGRPREPARRDRGWSSRLPALVRTGPRRHAQTTTTEQPVTLTR